MVDIIASSTIPVPTEDESVKNWRTIREGGSRDVTVTAYLGSFETTGLESSRYHLTFTPESKVPDDDFVSLTYIDECDPTLVTIPQASLTLHLANGDGRYDADNPDTLIGAFSIGRGIMLSISATDGTVTAYKLFSVVAVTSVSYSGDEVIITASDMSDLLADRTFRCGSGFLTTLELLMMRLGPQCPLAMYSTNGEAVRNVTFSMQDINIQGAVLDAARMWAADDGTVVPMSVAINSSDPDGNLVSSETIINLMPYAVETEDIVRFEALISRPAPMETPRYGSLTVDVTSSDGVVSVTEDLSDFRNNLTVTASLFKNTTTEHNEGIQSYIARAIKTHLNRERWSMESECTPEIAPRVRIPVQGRWGWAVYDIVRHELTYDGSLTSRIEMLKCDESEASAIIDTELTFTVSAPGESFIISQSDRTYCEDVTVNLGVPIIGFVPSTTSGTLKAGLSSNRITLNGIAVSGDTVQVIVKYQSQMIGVNLAFVKMG